MDKKIKVLVLSGSEDRIRSIIKILDDYGFQTAYETVVDPESFSLLLAKSSWSVVIAENSLHDFDLKDAIRLLKKSHQDIPFIIISDTGNEETVVNLLKAGASDYIRKDDFIRLPAAVENEIKNAGFRRKHKKALGRLKENEKRFRLLAENASDIIYIYRFRPKEGYEYISPSVEKKLGYGTERFYRDPDFACKIVHKGDAKILYEIKSGDFDFTAPVEFRLNHENGSSIWFEEVLTPFYDKNGILMAVQGIMRDITRRKNAEEQLAYLSFHDSLTDLYNRAYFEEGLKRLNTPRQLPLSIIIADVNALKLINDAFGHTEGDRLLKNFSKVLKRCCRAEDIVARWGGDEFSMLIPRTNKKDAAEVLNRIKKICAASKGNKIPLSVSIGTATKTDKGENFKNVLKRAEDHMYRNKLLETKSIVSTIIASLEQTLFEKSEWKESHFKSMLDISVRLGEACNLTDKKMDDLRMLSSLHDIGKVAILDNILNKKESLTSREWEIIKRHPEIGYRIAMSSHQLSNIAEYILTAHERWDGKGYPQGLKGVQIPLLSRIIALVDAYLAMREGRTYKKPVDKETAIREIKNCSGTQFDPSLVKKLVKILK
ncbi:MAG: diguanylate cyclase [Actinobacteria bacterium]|nr:diguanylate cyclase [Actinomycetota bacterium]